MKKQNDYVIADSMIYVIIKNVSLVRMKSPNPKSQNHRIASALCGRNLKSKI